MYFTFRQSQLNISKVEQAFNLCRNFLTYFNGQPKVAKCQKKMGTQYISRTSIDYHANNVLDILNFKVQGNNDIYLQLRSKIGHKWKSDLLREWGITNTISVNEASKIQAKFKLTDAPFYGITRAINNVLGRRIFPSASKVQSIRKTARSQSASVTTIILQRDSINNYDTRKFRDFDIWYAHENEIVNALFDKQINNNNHTPLPSLSNGLWFQYGGDKGTKTGYAASMTIIGPLLSAVESLPCLYIPGSDIGEHASNLRKCYQNMNYSKLEFWKSLSKQPGIVNLVLYHLDLEMNIDSRLVYSCLVCINPYKQSIINTIIDDSDVEMKREELKLNKDQFDKSWKLAKSRSRIKNNNWKSALEELKGWEENYLRPQDVGCMSERERKGDFGVAGVF